MSNESNSSAPASAVIAKKLDETLLISEIFSSRKSFAMLGLAFSAGLPILLVYTVLSAWLREAGVSRTAIGFFVWVGFAYSLKMLWAPLIDRFKVPGFSKWLGNRRGWTLLSIFGTAAAMLAMAFQDPAQDLAGVALCAVLLAFSSATLDICVDAWRVDSGTNEEQATLSAIYQLGYRLGMIMAVSGGLFFADLGGFGPAYAVLGLLAVIGGSTLLWAPASDADSGIARPNVSQVLACLGSGLLFLAAISLFLGFGLKDGGFLRSFGGVIGDAFSGLFSFMPELMRVKTLRGLLIFTLCLPFLAAGFFLTFGRKMLKTEATYVIPIIGDFADIVRRTGWMSLAVIAIVATYRISDTTMGVMAMPLYIDLGYEKTTIGSIKGLFGITVMIVGAFLGGISAVKIGLARSMIIGAIILILTNLAFAWLATVSSPKAIYLLVTIGADNIAAGFTGSVFIAFMSIMTSRKFTATQYALFSSLFAFYGKSLAGFSGQIADAVGYELFFIITSAFGIPALILVIVTWLSGFTDKMMAADKA